MIPLKTFMRAVQAYSGHLMGRDFQLHSPQNGALWNSAIDYVYEQQLICFSYTGVGSKFRLHVLDEQLLSTELKTVGPYK